MPQGHQASTVETERLLCLSAGVPMPGVTFVSGAEWGDLTALA
jgi:hypothetical protein